MQAAVEGNWVAEMSARTNSDSGGEDGGTGDEHICGKCRLEFIDLSDFLQHKRSCTRKRLVLVVGDDSSDDLGVEGRSTSSMDFTDDAERYGRELSTIPYLIPSSYEKPDSPDSCDFPPFIVSKGSRDYMGCEDQPLDLENYLKTEISANSTIENLSNDIKRSTIDHNPATLPSTLPQYILAQSVSDTNVTLQALQNTRVAVAQQAAGANTLSHLAALQTALYTLQQQQIIQLQVIQQLVGPQRSQTSGATPSTPTKHVVSVTPSVGSLTGTAALTPPQSTDGNMSGVLALTTTAPSLLSIDSAAQAENLTVTSTASSASPTTSSTTTLTDSILQPLAPPPLPHEPNTLELLQRHTEQALQNTMAGSSFLLNGLSGLGNSSDFLRFYKKGDVKREGGDDALFRHRCRFCGKVFSSDSALQIHIRSHTGERPFKCNVCGNRFSTKGNLKVHFQRHESKYPLAGIPQQSPNLTSSQPISLITHNHERECRSPRDQSTLDIRERHSENGTPQLQPRSVSPNEASNMYDDSDGSVGEDYGSDENEMKEGAQSHYDDDIMDNDDSLSSSLKPEYKENDENNDEDTKPLTSENSAVIRVSIPSYISTSASTFPNFFHPSLSPSFTMAPMCFPPLSTPPQTSTPTTRPSGTVHNCTNNNNEADNNNSEEKPGPLPDPNFYQDLLPKPGSNDNSWESLMEVTKTSETSKLQQLVDNIEHKLSDPNQCAICHRVLSCKSALQMHYRTHTGERPFKCKICSRAFTTKGNLKTHMGVHRVKPPLRVLHQCPVCHKQFTNSLVLQQHIRMHTGEPTDMHPEQIMASEVRPSHLLATSFPRPIIPTLMPNFSTPPAPPPRSSPVASTTPKISDVASLIPSPVPSATESVINTVQKSKDSTPDDEQPSSPETPSTSRPSSARPDRCNTPQPPVLISSSCPITTSAIITSTRVSSPSMDKPIVTTAPYSPVFTASLAALENHVKAINTTIPQPLPFSPFGLGLAMGGFLRYEESAYLNRNQLKDMSMNQEKSPAPFPSYSPSPNTSRAESDGSADERSTPGSTIKGESPVNLYRGPSTIKPETEALDLTPKNNTMSVPLPVPEMTLFPSPLAGLPFQATPGRLSTTCRICFKTFACNSALEIHYRSHTKERPYKCNVCDRGFSTKGNMKQHMLTHKIRDLPPQLFAIADSSVTDTETNSSTNAVSPPSSNPHTPANESNLSQASNHNSDKKEFMASERASSPVLPVTTPLHAPVIATTTTTSNQSIPTSSAPPKNIKQDSESSNKKHHFDHNSSLPKRPGYPKHFCHICQKPFSSASALQIHNRTHSGERPFKCIICGRAFTTKGNLKVHMGTHLHNNGTSRRGRRMSLEFPPPPLPAHGKQDFSHHSRPDLYFPFMPPTYMNGMTGPPKMNEISVIQSATGLTNGNVSTSVSMTMTPAVSMMTPVMTLGQHQPFARKQSQSNNDSGGTDYVDPRSPDEAENLKVQPSPTRPPESASPVCPTRVTFPSNASVKSATWSWKIACNVCSKICSSSSDLEVHLKSHCNPAVQNKVRAVTQTAK